VVLHYIRSVGLHAPTKGTYPSDLAGLAAAFLKGMKPCSGELVRLRFVRDWRGETRLHPIKLHPESVTFASDDRIEICEVIVQKDIVQV